MTAKIDLSPRLKMRSMRKLRERSAVLYARSLERWNSRAPLPNK